MESTVNITDVSPGSRRVRADSVRAGDYVHDTSGNPDRVIRVHYSPKRRSVMIVPEKLWPITLGPADEITIVRQDDES